MAYPQGYLYQPSASLALYSCPAYSAGVLSGPRTEELGRSSSGSAFAPYAGSTAFTGGSPGYSSHLPYSADAAAAAATFTSYVVSKLKVIIRCGGCERGDTFFSFVLLFFCLAVEGVPLCFSGSGAEEGEMCVTGECMERKMRENGMSRKCVVEKREIIELSNVLLCGP